MPDVLPGYTYDRTSSRYRSARTGQFVSRSRITSLLETQVNSAEQRLGDLTVALYEGRVAPSVWVEQMRTELNRLHLQNSALGAGGWDNLTQADYGRIGGRIRNDYRRVEQLARDIINEDVTIGQANNRVRGYIGNARAEFFTAQRDRQRNRPPDAEMVTIERRLLFQGAKHCRDCPGHYDRGWEMAGILPLPTEQCECGNFCRCRMISRDVPAEEVGEWIGTKRSG